MAAEEHFILTKERKTVYNRFRSSLVFFPFLVLCFGNLFLPVFIDALSAEPLLEQDSFRTFVRYGQTAFSGFDNKAFLLYFLLVYWWARPVLEFLQGNAPQLKETVQKRVGNLPRYIISGHVIVFIVFALLHCLRFREFILPERFFLVILPSLVLSFITQIVFAIIYADCIVFNYAAFFEILYEKEELYEKRGGISFSLWSKILLLIGFSIILPLGAIMYVLYFKYGGNVSPVVIHRILYSLYFSLIIVVVGLSFLSQSLAGPMEELNKKMDRLATGDFGVKTRIFANDEIGRLKYHFNKMVDDLKERQVIRDIFGKYLSDEIAKKLMDGELSLGGEEVQGAVLFSDIRGFTAMSEKMSAPEVVEFLNRYFSFVAEPILERGGVINKFIGDAVMVIFSPVFGHGNYQKQAVRTALDMRKALERFNRKYPEYGEVGFGVGIHSGNLVAGNIGVQDRLEYTVIGDTVNLASRLEGQTKELTRDIIVSETVAKALDEDFAGEVALEEVTTVTVKGKDEPITVYSFA